MNEARIHGLKWIAAGAVLGGVWIACVLLLDQVGWSLWGPGLGVPLVPFLIGLTELVSGRSFGALARSWDELKGWQRGLLGLVIVGVAGSVIVFGIGIVLSFLLK